MSADAILFWCLLPVVVGLCITMAVLDNRDRNLYWDWYHQEVAAGRITESNYMTEEVR